ASPRAEPPHGLLYAVRAIPDVDGDIRGSHVEIPAQRRNVAAGLERQTAMLLPPDRTGEPAGGGVRCLVQPPAPPASSALITSAIFSPTRTELMWVLALGTHGKMLASATLRF